MKMRFKEHPLKEHMCNFKIGKITYSNLQSITTYDNSKNKPLLYPQMLSIEIDVIIVKKTYVFISFVEKYVRLK